MTMLFPKRHRNKTYLIKVLISGMRSPLWSCQSRESQRLPEQHALAVAHGCLPEVEGVSLLLKTHCTLDTGPKGSELDLT